MGKTIKVFHCKIFCGKYNVSGLISIFIDVKEKAIVSVNNIFISGDALFDAKIEVGPEEFVEMINVYREKYGNLNEYSEMSKNYLLHKVDSKQIESLVSSIDVDYTMTIKYLQKIIKESLNIDNIDFKVVVYDITLPKYVEMSINSRIESLTMDQKIKIASQYYDGDKKLAEQAVNKNIDDIGVVTVHFKGNTYRGVAVCIVNLVIKKILFIYIWIDEPEIVMEELNDLDTVASVFQAVASNSKKVSKFSTSQNEIQSDLWKLNAEIISDAIEKKSEDIIQKQIMGVLKSANQGDIKISITKLNSVKFHYLFNPSKFLKEDDVNQIDELPGAKLVNVDLVLSPTKGKRVSELEQGDFIYVLIDTSSPQGYNVAKALNLIVDNKNTPIEAEVYSINYNEQEGFKIFLKITETVFDKAIEEQDVKVKIKLSKSDSFVEQDSSNLSLIIGLVAGFIVIGLIVLFFIL